MKDTKAIIANSIDYLCICYEACNGVFPNEIQLSQEQYGNLLLDMPFTSGPTDLSHTIFFLGIPFVVTDTENITPAYNESRDKNLKGSIYV